jgi:hypothetical protein
VLFSVSKFLVIRSAVNIHLFLLFALWQAVGWVEI